KNSASHGLFSQDSKLLLTIGPEPTQIQMWDAQTGQHLRSLESKDKLEDFALSPDGAWLVSAGGKEATVWDLNSGAPVLALEGHSDTVLYSFFSPDGTRIATVSQDNTIKIWETSTGKQLYSLAHTTLQKPCFSTDSKLLFSTERYKIDDSTPLFPKVQI